MKYLICLLFVLSACNYDPPPPTENFGCTLFLTEYIPAAEDFPAYLACRSDQDRVVFLWWHEVQDIINEMVSEDIDKYALPNRWFDNETGEFRPAYFWPELSIIHQINGIHNPCEVPELVEFADLECFDVVAQESIND